MSAASTHSRWRFAPLKCFCEQPTNTEEKNKHADHQLSDVDKSHWVITGVDVFLTRGTQQEGKGHHIFITLMEYQVNHVEMLVCVIGYFICIGHKCQVIIGCCIGWKKSKSFLTGLSLYSKVNKKRQISPKMRRELFELLNNRHWEKSWGAAGERLRLIVHEEVVASRMCACKKQKKTNKQKHRRAFHSFLNLSI